MATNYQSKWWGWIYDQMMEEDLSDWLENNRRFYKSNLMNIHGAVLECACGTGLILLPLLQSGCDMYGFDISTSMLDSLHAKAKLQGIVDAARRISVQDLETFSYEQQFEAILIPTNSFSMLSTQEAQIRALRNIFAHLAPRGKLLLDLRLASIRGLAETPEIVEGTWYTWKHPQTGRPIRQRIVGSMDFSRQLVLDHCFIEYDGQSEDFLMTARWIFKDEFQLLLLLAGFERWEAYGSPDGDRLVTGLDGTNSYWVIQKTG
jgi:SAM-dependent methyltransferase